MSEPLDYYGRCPHDKARPVSSHFNNAECAFVRRISCPDCGGSFDEWFSQMEVARANGMYPVKPYRVTPHD